MGYNFDNKFYSANSYYNFFSINAKEIENNGITTMLSINLDTVRRRIINNLSAQQRFIHLFDSYC